MSYYFGVWEGAPPLSNAHARSEFERKWDGRGQGPPSPTMQRLVDGLLAVHPDIDQPDGTESPWADCPLVHCIDGSAAYLPVRTERATEIASLIEQQTSAVDLVAFDPQRGTLVPSATEIDRSTQFELPSPGELPIHLRALLSEALAAPRPQVAVLEQSSTGFYLQWMAQRGAITAEAQGDRVLPVSLQLTPEARSLMDHLGFVQATPNWRMEWLPGPTQVIEAAEALARVLVEVRALPTGEPMSLHTFPLTSPLTSPVTSPLTGR